MCVCVCGEAGCRGSNRTALTLHKASELTSVSVRSKDRSLIAEYFMHGAPARRGSAGARHGDSASCSAAVDARNGKSQLTRAPAICAVCRGASGAIWQAQVDAEGGTGAAHTTQFRGGDGGGGGGGGRGGGRSKRRRSCCWAI